MVARKLPKTLRLLRSQIELSLNKSQGIDDCWNFEQLFESMDKIAEFRNFIAHHYGKIYGAIVVTLMRKHLDDFIAFRDAVLQVLEKESAAEIARRQR